VRDSSGIAPIAQISFNESPSQSNQSSLFVKNGMHIVKVALSGNASAMFFGLK
jgi:hypothetical protein